MNLVTLATEHRSAIALGLLLLLLAWETFSPFRKFYAKTSPQWQQRGRHFAWNGAIGLLNTIIVAVVFVGLWSSTMQFAAQQGIGLGHWFTWDNSWSRLVVMILLLDVWTYSWHRLNHRLPWLWHFHRLHHADTQMDVTTAHRFHAGEIIISSILRLPVLLLLGANIVELAIYETLLFAAVQFHHANIALPEKLDRTLRLVVVTPALHKVHHSIRRREADSNYSSLFSWWDRIFRTWLLMPPDQRPQHYGVED